MTNQQLLNKLNDTTIVKQELNDLLEIVSVSYNLKEFAMERDGIICLQCENGLEFQKYDEFGYQSYELIDELADILPVDIEWDYNLGAIELYPN
jgi:hypothetical protein